MYQTIQGDTFDKIAKKIYDDEFLMDVLIKANPEHSRTVIFPAGVSLNTPSVPSKKSLRRTSRLGKGVSHERCPANKTPSALF